MTTPATCPDCAAHPGQPHVDGCDVARCLWTGHQRLACDCEIHAEAIRKLRQHGENETADQLAYHHGITPDQEAHDCGGDIWTGEWPGLEDVARLGLDSLNDLHRWPVIWNREAQRWEKAA